MSSTKLEAENFLSSGISPRKRQIDQKPDSTLFSDSMNIDFEGNGLFGKSLLTMGKSVFGVHDPLGLNDLHWDNNPQLPSLLSRGPSINCDQPVSKKIKTSDEPFKGGSSFLNVSMNAGTSNIIDTSCNLLNATGLTNFLGSEQASGRSFFQTSFGTQLEDSTLVINNTSSNQDQSQLALTKKDLSSNTQTIAKNNRRDTKEEQKKTKKGDQETKKAVTFQISKKQASNSNEESSFTQGDSTMDQIMRLTNKKREYLEEAIQDRNGKFCYDEDPREYKKARKRMQNRESAVRSRLRKKYHQDELEVKIIEMEQIQKQISEQNAGLAAQNALLKKQLAYFEDIFAKSSLLGFDPVAQNPVNKNDLEEFQKNLLNKINQRLYNQDQNELETQPFVNNSLQLQPQRRSGLDDSDHLSSTSISDPLNQNLSSFQNSDDRIDSLRLVRSRSNSSNFSNTGYLFLAVVFCMMCCSSLLVGPSSMIKMASQTQGFSKILGGNGLNNFGVAINRKLMSASQEGKTQARKQSNLASQLNDDVEMISDTTSTSSNNLIREESEIGAVSFMKMMLAGQYTYLTYMILSTTCFFFWLTPNCHKIRKLFSFSNHQQQELITRKRRVAQCPPINERQVLTRSQSSSQNQKIQQSQR